MKAPKQDPLSWWCESSLRSVVVPLDLFSSVDYPPVQLKWLTGLFCLSGPSDSFRPLEKHRYHHEEEWPEKEGFAWTGSCFSFQCRNNFGVWSSARKIRDVQVSLICHLDKHCSVVSSIRALFSYWGTISGSKVWNRLCWLCAWGKVTLALGDSPARPLKDSQEETRHCVSWFSSRTGSEGHGSWCYISGAFPPVWGGSCCYKLWGQQYSCALEVSRTWWRARKISWDDPSCLACFKSEFTT